MRTQLIYSTETKIVIKNHDSDSENNNVGKVPIYSVSYMENADIDEKLFIDNSFKLVDSSEG